MFGWGSVYRSYCSNIWTGWPELSSSVCPYYVHYMHRGARPKVCYITLDFATDASQKWSTVLSLFRKCKKPSHRTIVKRCCYFTVDSATTALQTVLAHIGATWKIWNYENCITLFCLEKNKLFDNTMLTQNNAWHVTHSYWINYLV